MSRGRVVADAGEDVLGERNATEQVEPARSGSPSPTVASPPCATVGTRKTAARDGGVTTG
ncbi:hypothetical protein ACIA8E_13405 [Streptomyces sp. NPDC051664]|uniref:hypothetical protein n=1 Tax=Streptomyces sp. NPDC051664 TaxID=3365668 RepID=UPI0037ABEFE9